MQNVISLQQVKEQKQEQTVKKAILLANMHVFMNDAEKRRKELYCEYSKAILTNNNDLTNKLALEITEAGGMLRAFRKCENLIAINA